MELYEHGPRSFSAYLEEPTFDKIEVNWRHVKPFFPFSLISHSTQKSAGFLLIFPFSPFFQFSK
jgi:hypothetical protein